MHFLQQYEYLIIITSDICVNLIILLSSYLIKYGQNNKLEMISIFLLSNLEHFQFFYSILLFRTNELSMLSDYAFEFSCYEFFFIWGSSKFTFFLSGLSGICYSPSTFSPIIRPGWMKIKIKDMSSTTELSYFVQLR